MPEGGGPAGTNRALCLRDARHLGGTEWPHRVHGAARRPARTLALARASSRWAGAVPRPIRRAHRRARLAPWRFQAVPPSGPRGWRPRAGDGPLVRTQGSHPGHFELFGTFGVDPSLGTDAKSSVEPINRSDANDRVERPGSHAHPEALGRYRIAAEHLDRESRTRRLSVPGVSSSKERTDIPSRACLPRPGTHPTSPDLRGSP